jgi:hypothetical protein
MYGSMGGGGMGGGQRRPFSPSGGMGMSGMPRQSPMMQGVPGPGGPPQGMATPPQMPPVDEAGSVNSRLLDRARMAQQGQPVLNAGGPAPGMPQGQQWLDRIQGRPDGAAKDAAMARYDQWMQRPGAGFQPGSNPEMGGGPDRMAAQGLAAQMGAAEGGAAPGMDPRAMMALRLGGGLLGGGQQQGGMGRGLLNMAMDPQMMAAMQQMRGPKPGGQM